MKPLTIEERDSIREYLVGLIDDWGTCREDYNDHRAALVIACDRSTDDVSNCEGRASMTVFGRPSLLLVSIISTMNTNKDFARVICIAADEYRSLKKSEVFAIITDEQKN